MKFQVLDEFVYRAPAFKWSEIEKFCHLETAHLALKNEEIRSAIQLASPNLITRLEQSQHPLPPDLAMILIRYLTRMSVRSTPFGYFSGIGIGQITNKTAFERKNSDSGQSRKLFLSNSEKLYHQRLALQQAISKKNYSALKKIKWINNPMSIRFDFLTRLPHRTLTQSSQKTVFVAAVIPDIIKKILKILPADLETIASHIAHKSEKDQALDFLLSMIDFGWLVPNETPLFETSLVSVGDTDSKTQNQLKSEHAKLGFVEMKEPCSLSAKDAQKLLAACEVLASCVTPDEADEAERLRASLEKFMVNNYEGRSVPLLSLTESLLQLGPRELPSTAERDLFIIRKLTDAKVHDVKEWALGSTDLHILRNQNAPELSPVWSVLANVIASENMTQTLMHPLVICSKSATRLHGRFGPAFSEVSKQILNIHQKEIQHSAVNLADLEVDPTHDRCIDLMVRTSGLKSYVDLKGTTSKRKKRIPLSDLAFKLNQHDEVQLISISRNEPVEIYLTHAYLHQLDQSFYFKLLGAYAERNVNHFVWSWGKHQYAFDYFPRVTLGDIVVSPRMWRPGHLKNEDAILAANLPEKVFIKDRDQRLLVDLTKTVGRKILLKELKSRTNLLVTEVLPGEINSSFEVILTAELKQKTTHAPSKIKKVKPPRPTDLIPHGVLSFNLTADPQDFDYLLSKIKESVRPSTEWLFVKYRTENSPQLRVRFFNAPGLEKKIIQLFSHWQSIHLIHQFEQTVYARELERYSGKTLCCLFENLSCADSAYQLELNNKLQNNGVVQSESIKIKIALEILKNSLNSFGLSKSQQIEFCKKIVYSKKLNKNTRAIQKSPIAVSEFENKLISDHFSNFKLKNYFSQFKRAAVKLEKSAKERWIISALHMSLNRCHGFSESEEQLIYRIYLTSLITDINAQA